MEWKRRALFYACHLRETNLAYIFRQCLTEKQSMHERVLAELINVPKADLENQGQSEPCSAAIAFLEADPENFVHTYFIPNIPNATSRGPFSVTSK